jgi:plastocyanin
MSTSVRRAVAAASAATLLLTFAACGGDDDDDAGDDGATATTSADAATDSTSSDGGVAGDVTYEVTSVAYTPLSAPAGGTVAVANSSGVGHTLTADDGSFDVSFGSGETATVDVPAAPGDYPFHCEIHPSMTATLTAQ